MFDLNNQFLGDVQSHFIVYDSTTNRALILNIFEKIEPDVSDGDKETMAEYPETTTCMSDVNSEYHDSMIPNESTVFQDMK